MIIITFGLRRNRMRKLIYIFISLSLFSCGKDDKDSDPSTSTAVQFIYGYFDDDDKFIPHEIVDL